MASSRRWKIGRNGSKNMRKKDYELIVKILKKTKPNYEEDSLNFRGRWMQWETQIVSFAYELEKENSAFNWQSFIDACGVIIEKGE